MRQPRYEEQWARACIKHAIQGCTVEPHDDGICQPVWGAVGRLLLSGGFFLLGLVDPGCAINPVTRQVQSRRSSTAGLA